MLHSIAFIHFNVCLKEVYYSLYAKCNVILRYLRLYHSEKPKIYKDLWLKETLCIYTSQLQHDL